VFSFNMGLKKPSVDNIWYFLDTKIALMQKVMQQFFNHSTFCWHLNLSVHESLFVNATYR